MNVTPTRSLTRQRPRWPRLAAALAWVCARLRGLDLDAEAWPHYLLAAACLVAGIAIGWLR